MKTFVVLVLTVTALFLWQRNGTQTTATSPKSEAKTVTVTQPSSRPVSEGDWAKHSIDRAREVAGQVQATRRENDRP